jgi:DNA primase|tara:strand:+ start:578 stop:2365 length:1788 start_codon:yes stop_codon:yes gene_type:complete
MKYPKEYLDEIKIRLKVSQVVGKSVKLKRRGKEFIGLSPFSNEKTPSFTVNDEKGFYHCFSSAEHGNIFDFLMKTKNYKFGEAVRVLASDAGMQPYRFTKQDEEKQNRWKIYNTILEKYANFCHEELVSEKYLEVKEYLNKRKISKKEISFFKIGYASTNNNFHEKLIEEFNEKQISSSGIYYLDEKRKKYIDRFRNRIIFPVKSLNNSVFALGGRTISKTTFAKYINSPETEFYKKGNNLYNINSAKEFSNKDDEVFIVEGYMDVINLHKFGIKNVVANLGTAITEKQIDLIWKFFKNPIICLDGDSSGQKAALRAAERLFPLMKPDVNIYFLTLPENLDPDAYINQKGKESFLKFTGNKVEIQNFIWDFYYQGVDRNNPHSLSLFEKKIKSLCNDMKDKTLAKYFLDHFIQKINELTPNLNYKKNQFFKFNKMINPLQKTKEVYKQRNKFSEKELKELSILFLIINNLDIFRKNTELISKITFSSNIITEFQQKLIVFLLSEKLFNRKKLRSEEFDVKFRNIINLINVNAPVKTITKNKNEAEIFIMFNEIIREIEKIDLRKKVEFLENKVSLNLDEKLYSELLSLRNQLKGG